ncbi:MAG TPA: glycosyltransferase [Solirubrobacteraceae bacterium]|nr:glycosyltransferase [Solirubrobacteraceae bacterium]
MIAFGCSITDDVLYARCAEPGIRRAAEPDSEIIANSAAGSIFRSYNLIMEQAARHEDLEALVLVHQDAEIADPDFARKVRDALADPNVGVVGCVGAIDVRSIAWWEGSVTWASFTHRYPEFGGGDVPAFSWWEEKKRPGYARTGEVDTIDGFVMVLSPWVVSKVRFDETLMSQIHGYDFDFCLQVRELGRKVATTDFQVVHHHSLKLVSNRESWMQAHMKVADKWEGRMPGIGLPNWGAAPEDWRTRARLAEAEAGAARLERASMELVADAHERELKVMRDSVSWRVTAPMRRVSAWARGARRSRR